MVLHKCMSASATAWAVTVEEKRWPVRWGRYLDAVFLEELKMCIVAI
jgi:hypothetical protein